MPSSSRELGVATFGIALAGLLFSYHRHRYADPLTLHELSALFGANYDHTILSMSAATSISGRGLWTLKAVPAGVDVDPGIGLLRRTWVDLERSLDACLHGNGKEIHATL